MRSMTSPDGKETQHFPLTLPIAGPDKADGPSRAWTVMKTVGVDPQTYHSLSGHMLGRESIYRVDCPDHIYAVCVDFDSASRTIAQQGCAHLTEWREYMEDGLEAVVAVYNSRRYRDIRLATGHHDGGTAVATSSSPTSSSAMTVRFLAEAVEGCSDISHLELMGLYLDGLKHRTRILRKTSSNLTAQRGRNSTETSEILKIRQVATDLEVDKVKEDAALTEVVARQDESLYTDLGEDELEVMDEISDLADVNELAVLDLCSLCGGPAENLRPLSILALEAESHRLLRLEEVRRHPFSSPTRDVKAEELSPTWFTAEEAFFSMNLAATRVSVLERRNAETRRLQLQRLEEERRSHDPSWSNTSTSPTPTANVSSALTTTVVAAERSDPRGSVEEERLPTDYRDLKLTAPGDTTVYQLSLEDQRLRLNSWKWRSPPGSTTVEVLLRKLKKAAKSSSPQRMREIADSTRRLHTTRRLTTTPKSWSQRAADLKSLQRQLKPPSRTSPINHSTSRVLLMAWDELSAREQQHAIMMSAQLSNAPISPGASALQRGGTGWKTTGLGRLRARWNAAALKKRIRRGCYEPADIDEMHPTCLTLTEQLDMRIVANARKTFEKGLKDAGVVNPITDLPSDPTSVLDTNDIFEDKPPDPAPPWLAELEAWTEAVSTLQ
eukprot:gene18789-22446_t